MLHIFSRDKASKPRLVDGSFFHARCYNEDDRIRDNPGVNYFACRFNHIARTTRADGIARGRADRDRVDRRMYDHLHTNRPFQNQ